MTTTNKERVIHSDVMMRAVETPIEGVAGAFKRDFYLIGSPDVLKAGESIFVRTRKPWPAHVTVTETVPVPDSLKKFVATGMICTAFQFVPRETTKRVAGEVRVSQGERIDRLQSEVGALIAKQGELLDVLRSLVGEAKSERKK